MSTPRSRKQRATAAERLVADELGGRRTPNSGAGFEKADVVTHRKLTVTDAGRIDSNRFDLRVEVKTTEKDYYSLRGTEWTKVAIAATRRGQVPLFSISLEVTALVSRFTVMPVGFFKEITGITPFDYRARVQKSFRVSRSLWKEWDEYSVGIRGYRIPFHRVDLQVPRLRTNPAELIVMETTAFLQELERADT